ncbi:type IX secretion system ring subunit PorN/GldN [Tenacibaculum maritimum]|uniref:type IX secretion system ring protein PorN/GldN n=1 Tax=Tenacibaculum maritimum TaxID=107401 RepID=UPI0004635BA6|nr:gliding motility protein GldN [Tenacibaculum maritimum]CAA0159036.1 Gliding motility protein GldN [Tenacibaculum maritimum]CAA0163384.1 Gliding motility protein GldN [Tenacibaculum maritimum]CAA0165584.1 Gliding motility protein GldN [Tenacibaculum maritimum]CAA0167078.1 Gliding motility protein GldN [Tenacibaculum maritimum]CAA0198933.1 Gliding motility protein GldN [Tenacibaculum maritimum]
MDWKRFYIVLFVFAATSVANAQANLLNAVKADDIGKITEAQKSIEDDKPLPYGYISDRDVLWSKVVWEYIDINQKINLPYYYPIDTTSTSNRRRSLFDTLLRGINSGKITEIYTDSYFTTKTTPEEIKKVVYNERQNGDYKDIYSIQSADIKGYLLKGLWYFDKRQGELKYRLLAIAPMGPDVQTIGIDEIDDKDSVYELFWVFYPDARDELHKSKVFNSENSAQPISYDNLLNARRFNSTIVREENLYGDRKIKDYIRGNSLFQLLEADRIKEGIRDREMDMWNY